MILMSLAVALLDGLTTFLVIKDREAWISGDIRRALVVEALVTAAIGVNLCVFVEFTWLMIPPSVLGGVIGRYLAWKY
jgi:hypothetical protein